MCLPEMFSNVSMTCVLSADLLPYAQDWLYLLFLTAVIRMLGNFIRLL